MDAAERRRVELASIDAAQSRVADFGKEFLATVERAMASAGRR
jgi:hypothetical protein